MRAMRPKLPWKALSLASTVIGLFMLLYCLKMSDVLRFHPALHVFEVFYILTLLTYLRCAKSMEGSDKYIFIAIWNVISFQAMAFFLLKGLWDTAG